LHKSIQHWLAKEQIRLGATLVDQVCIEESKEDEAKEQHFVGAQIL
jgi:hypothetical protein